MTRTMLPDESADALANILLRAHRGGPLADDAPLAAAIPAHDAAYGVQERLFARLDPSPGPPRWWKSGAATRADTPLHAPLPAPGIRTDGAQLADLALWQPLVEAEVALRLGRSVSPQEARALSPAGAAALVDGIAVAIELLGFRWAAGRRAPLPLKLADLLSHGALVLGRFQPFSASAAPDWATLGGQVLIGGAEPFEFRGSLGIVDPLWVLPAWLRHATRHGDTLPAGTVVTTGSWCGLREAAPGDTVAVAFDGLGAVSARL